MAQTLLDSLPAERWLRRQRHDVKAVKVSAAIRYLLLGHSVNGSAYAYFYEASK